MSDDHLVSKTYLKWFENPEIRKVHCSFYKLVKGVLKWSNPVPKDKNQICYEVDRYDRDTEEVFQKAFEEDWNNFIEYLNEYDFSKLTKNHYKKNSVLDADQVRLILNLIMIHYKRSKKVRDENKSHPAVLESIKEFEEVIDRKMTDEELKEFHKDIDNIFAKEPQKDSINYLKKRPWLLSINLTSTPFITSSKPVIWHNEINKIGIYIALSPKFSILIPLAKFKQKSGIIIEYISETNVKGLNILIKESVIADNPDTPIIISNKESALEDLIN